MDKHVPFKQADINELACLTNSRSLWNSADFTFGEILQVFQVWYITKVTDLYSKLNLWVHPLLGKQKSKNTNSQSFLVYTGWIGKNALL